MKGKFAFDGKGGEYFSLILVQGLLTCITLGIYAAWYQMNLYTYLCGHLSLGERDGDSAA